MSACADPMNVEAPSATALIRQRLQHASISLPRLGARSSGRLRAYDGMLLQASGISAPTGTLCRLTGGDGTTIDAEVIGFRDDNTLLMKLDAEAAVSPDSRISVISSDPSVKVGDELLGRVLDGRGRAIDGGLQPVPTETQPLHARPRNPLDNLPVSKPLDVGVRSINALLSVGQGQRVGIIAGSGVGKSVLLGMMARFTAADVVVIGLIGERGREVSDFCEQHLRGESAKKTVVVAVPANHSAVLRIRAAERATAIAEHFRDRGKSVLLILDSLTRVAHAQREIGLALGEPPTTKGYPPSVFSLIPNLIERAGNSQGGGSITAIYTVLADGGDVEGDPVVDSARAILDGHFVLSRSLAERGQYPAIDLSKSVSRVMRAITGKAHNEHAGAIRRSNAVYEENADLFTLGAYQPGANPALDDAVKRRELFEAFMRQDAETPVTFEQAQADLAVAAGPL